MSGGDDKQEETPEEREAAEIAMERWEDYEERFRPVENEMMRAVRMGEDDYAYAGGKAGGAVESAFSEAEDQRLGREMQAGAAPGSGRFMEAGADIDEARAGAKGGGITRADDETENLHYRGLQKVVNLGSGIADDAQLGLSQVAANANEMAGREARSEQAEDAALGYGIGAVAGGVTRGLQTDSQPTNAERAESMGYTPWDPQGPGG